MGPIRYAAPEGPMVKVTWLYRAADTRMTATQIQKHEPQELFFSTATDENDITSVDAKCTVLT